MKIDHLIYHGHQTLGLGSLQQSPLNFFCVPWLWRAGAFSCQAPSWLKYEQFHQQTLKRREWPVLIGAKSFSSGVTDLPLVWREHRRSAHQTDSSGESEGPGGKKRLVSAFLGMGMPEATPLQRLPASRAASALVSHSQHDKLLNKPEDAPSIILSLEQFPSESSVKHVGVTGKQRKRGSDGGQVVTSRMSSTLWHGLWGKHQSQWDRFETSWTDTSMTKKNKQEVLSCYNMASKECVGIHQQMASRHLSGEIK